MITIKGGNELMKFLRGVLGYMIAGLFVMSVWDGFAIPYGIAGGYIAAIIIIGPMFYMNHYVGLIQNPDEDAFVDMALGIGVAGIFRDIFMNGISALTSTLPTLALVIVGAVIGGLTAAAVEKHMEKEMEETETAMPADEEPGPGYDEESVTSSKKAS